MIYLQNALSVLNKFVTIPVIITNNVFLVAENVIFDEPNIDYLLCGHLRMQVIFNTFQEKDDGYLITFAKSFDKNLLENNKTLPWLPGT
jgi:hypothetical protein